MGADRAAGGDVDRWSLLNFERPAAAVTPAHTPKFGSEVQEDFIVTGDETLEMLNTYIHGCDAVIHLVGDISGAIAKHQSVAAIAASWKRVAGHEGTIP